MNSKTRPEQLIRRTSVGFIVCIWVLAPYLLLQQFSLYPVYWLEESSLDKLVAVNLNAIYPYFSYYFLLIWAVFGTPNHQFVRFLKTVCMVTLVSHLCFFFFPTGVSRDSLPIDQAPSLYQWLVSWEKPRNCLPSLHASLAALSALALWKRGTFSGLFSSLWLVGILWSALALRQHLIIDLAAGVALAVVIWLLSRAKINW